VSSFLLAFGLIFVAELGDKSQLLVIAFAARYPLRIVVPAIFLATLMMHFVSVGVGQLAGAVLPLFWTQLAAGIAFIGFGLWTLRGSEEEEEEKAVSPGWGAFFTIAASFFLSEFGDKTMLAAVAIAGREQSFVAVWLGSALGMFTADALALVVGVVLGAKLPQRVMRYAAAAVFLVTGLFVLGELLLNR
jgi:putative Ca2+/H+ antiporter (TMEM165/GDT1 family)